MKYSDKLKDPRWQKKRLKILERDNWTCQKCGDTETTLNVHHLEYNGNPWEVNDKDLVTLCDHCHLQIEQLKKEGIDYNDVKIFKSNNWESGNRIMFASYKGTCSMEIFDKSNNYIIGFNIANDEAKMIIKNLRNSIIR